MYGRQACLVDEYTFIEERHACIVDGHETIHCLHYLIVMKVVVIV